MSQLAGLVHRFYTDAWNAWDDGAVDELLAADFVFRGSLGDEVRGRDGWRAYRDKVRAAVPDFHNEVTDLVVAGDRAAARLAYTGHHQGELLGVPGTGRRIAYSGAAFFTARDGLLTEAWVLGDLDTLRRQVGAPQPE
ncbi:ester cyclase [Amycolatopsis anabasis]|uniref:ester cyclase n=1 Tax=Amycolatopsis anabasis TaxID=1840409 RepID=UPI00131B5082|nr:ester cyclase [Amycolatopsis anabasis]